MSVLAFILFQLPMGKAIDLLTLMAPPLCLLLLLSSLLFLLGKRSPKIFLVDFACHKPPPSQSCTREGALSCARLTGNHTEEIIDFMKGTMEKAAISDMTYLSEGLLRVPMDTSLEAGRKETEMVIFGAIDNLLAKTKVHAQDIGILIVNCTIFNPIPSISSTIVRRYKLRDTIANYNLGGMGCTAGLVAIGLAKQLFKVHKNTYALVVSTENITGQYYKGNNRSKMVVNGIFRVGGAAILLSNRPSDANSSKYQLMHTVHTHTASSDVSYRCLFLEEDEKGFVGVTVNKDLLVAAVKAIKMNLTALGPLILPLSEKYLVLKNLLMKRFSNSEVQPYVPKFHKAVTHFFPHVGGKPVLDELQKKLGLSDATMEASRMSLYRLGNTSSAAVWYAVAYAEAKGRIKKGDSLWQMAFGSGFKCSSVVWRALRSIGYEQSNPWSDEIQNFPVDLSSIPPVTDEEFFFEQSK